MPLGPRRNSTFIPTAAPKPPKCVAFLTAGGIAPCLSSSLAYLIDEYSRISPSTKLIAYRCGYQGLLLGESVEITARIRSHCATLHMYGGSPIGNSRVKLTNVKDCVKRGLVKEGEDPQKVAADQLVKDGVDVLHTIGGDDTSTAAAALAHYLRTNGYGLCVVGLPKTIDNDIVPVQQSLGALTAAEQGARFFANVVAESTANPRMFIVHEVMGRDCGWLCAATAKAYQKHLRRYAVLPELFVDNNRLGLHAVYIPELDNFDIEKEAARLKKVMDESDCVNIFISEGACVETIIKELEAKGESIPKDAFGHYKLDSVNVGKWFGDQFASKIGAEKTLVQKSGYYARAAKANEADRALIRDCCELAVRCALTKTPGLIGHDEERGGELRPIEFERIKGGKKFDLQTDWFLEMLQDIGQPLPEQQKGLGAAVAALGKQIGGMFGGQEQA